MKHLNQYNNDSKSMQIYINEYIVKKKLDKFIDSESSREKVIANNENELVKIIVEEFKKSTNDVVDLNFIDISNITNMWSLFRHVAMGCHVDIKKLRNVDISKWDVSNVKYFRHTFFDYTNFDCDLSGWNVHNLENAEMMFSRCENFKGTGLDKWDVSNLKIASAMFSSCINLNVDLSNWNTSNIHNIDRMFYKCSNMNFDASNWDVSNVSNAYGVFGYCNPMNINVENWNLSKVLNITAMFEYCKTFNQDLSKWRMPSLVNTTETFLDCEDFDCDLSGWITKNIRNCAGMFEGCKNFKHDLSNWKIYSPVYNRRNMFKNCKLPKKYMPEFIKL